MDDVCDTCEIVYCDSTLIIATNRFMRTQTVLDAMLERENCQPFIESRMQIELLGRQFVIKTCPLPEELVHQITEC